MKHVAGESTIECDFQSIEITKDGSTMPSIKKLTTKKATGGGALFVHSEVILQLVNKNVVSVAQTLLIVLLRRTIRGVPWISR